MSQTAQRGEISAVPNEVSRALTRSSFISAIRAMLAEIKILLTGGGGYCKWVPSSGLKCNFNITTGP
ncbi:MAG: hypothetical protein AAB563_02330 [Patescibacteria group bacterium]